MAEIAQATTKVKLELEIDVDSVWGDNCTLEQVYKQSVDGAMLKIRNELKGVKSGIRIIGKPEIYAVILPPKK